MPVSGARLFVMTSLECFAWRAWLALLAPFVFLLAGKTGAALPGALGSIVIVAAGRHCETRH